jgi:hypothetical protein
MMKIRKILLQMICKSRGYLKKTHLKSLKGAGKSLALKTPRRAPS